MPKIGFSSGALYRLDKFSAAAFEAYAECGNTLVEICWNNQGEADRLMGIVPFVKQFSRVSIHLPGDIRYSTDDLTRSVLDKTLELYQATGAELVVVHPDLIEQTDMFRQYPMTFAAENMDHRKKAFKDVADMNMFFEVNDSWGMVLDLNHCFSNDPSMRLADDFISEFHDRIMQTHVSGFTGYHEPLYQTKQKNILDAAKNLNVPMIIESTFDSIDEVKMEYEFVTRFFSE